MFSCQNGSPKTGFWNTWIAVLHSVRFIILTPTRADTHIIHPHAITTARGDQARLPTPAHSELRSQPAFRVRGLYYVRAYGQLRVTPARSHAIPRRLASRGFGDDARLSHSVINHQTFTTNICPIRDTQVPKQMDPHTRGEPPRATTEDCTQVQSWRLPWGLFL